MSSGETTPPDLTKVQNQPSLTNYVELIRVDALCSPTPSKFEMVRWKNPPETLQHLFAAMGVFRGSYDLYGIPPRKLALYEFKLKAVSFDDLSERKAAYFAVKNTITCRRNMPKLTIALYNIWIQTGGAFEYIGVSVISQMKFPIQMPSRIMRFY